MNFVHLHVWERWIAAGSRENIDVQWHEGLTVRDLIPVPLAGRLGLTAHVNGSVVPPEIWASRVLSPEDHVDFAVRPAGPAVGAYLIQAAIAAAVSYVVTLILPKPKGRH